MGQKDACVVECGSALPLASNGETVVRRTFDENGERLPGRVTLFRGRAVAATKAAEYRALQNASAYRASAGANGGQ